MDKYALTTLGDADNNDSAGSTDMFGLDEFGQEVGAPALYGALIGGGVGTAAAAVARMIAAKPSSPFYKFSETVGLAAAGLAGGALMFFPNSRRMGMAAIGVGLVNNGLRQVEQLLMPPKFTVEELEKMLAVAQTAKDKKASVNDLKGVTLDPTGMIPPGAFGQDIHVQDLGNGFGIASVEPGYVVPANLPMLGTGTNSNGFAEAVVGPTATVPNGFGSNGFGSVTVDPGYLIPGSQQPGGFGGFGGFGQQMPQLVGPPTLANAGDYGMSDNPAVAQTQILGGPSISGLGAHYGATLYGPGQGG